jgi:hypothetical protein
VGLHKGSNLFVERLLDLCIVIKIEKGRIELVELETLSVKADRVKLWPGVMDINLLRVGPRRIEFDTRVWLVEVIVRWDAVID